MNLGQRLMDLRKEKKLSQERVADILNVTRQTISKWETDQSLPDFDKIGPICDLFEITADELINGKKSNNIEPIVNPISKINNVKVYALAMLLVSGVLLFFIAAAWFMIGISVLNLNPILCAAISTILSGVGICLIIFSKIVYGKEKVKKENSLYKQIDNIISTSTLILYLIISFLTSAWQISWIIWLLKILVMQIIKLILSLRGNEL